MRRFPMIVASAVSTAMIVVAVLALDSVGAHEGGRAQDERALVARFGDCLRDRGVDVPALRGAALERWLKDSDVPILDARACKTALADLAVKATSADADKLGDCLRAQGLNPPADPAALKEWIADRADVPAVKRALEECGAAGPAPPCGTVKDDVKKNAGE